MIAYLSTLTLVWACGLALYYGLLRHSPTHAASRAFLLATLGAGVVIPLLPQWGGGPELLPAAAALPRVVWLPAATVVAEAGAQAIPPAVWTALAVLAYALVGLVVSADVRRLARVIRSRRAVELPPGAPAVRVYESPSAGAPFSFGSAVYVEDWARLEPDAREALLYHEAAHARLGHTVDNVALAATCVALWWHPLAYGLRHALRLVHEYQADAAACERVDPARYRRVLLALQLGVAPSRLVAAFAHSPLKTRFTMMQSPFRQNRFARPLLAAVGLVLVGLACTKDEIDADLVAGVDDANADETLHAAARGAATAGMTLLGVDTIENFDPETYESTILLVRRYGDERGNTKYFEQEVGTGADLEAGKLRSDVDGWKQIASTSPNASVIEDYEAAAAAELIVDTVAVVDPVTGEETVHMIERPSTAQDARRKTEEVVAVSHALDR